MNAVEQVDVPAAVKKRAAAELFPGEKVLWAGRPHSTPLHLFDLQPPVGIILFFGGIHFAFSGQLPWLLPVFIAAAVWGLVVLLYPVWIRYGRARMLCMVTTNRAVRIYPWFWGGTRVESYGLALLSRTKVKKRRANRGDVVLGYRTMFSGGATYVRTYGRYPLGFVNIENPQAVADLILRECRRVLEESAYRLPVPQHEAQSDLTEEQDYTLYSLLKPAEFVCYAERADKRVDLRDAYLLTGSVCWSALSAAAFFHLVLPSENNGKWLMGTLCLGLLLWGIAGTYFRVKSIIMRRRLFYAFTTFRALELHPQYGVVQSYALRPSMMQEHTIRRDGSGSLILGYSSLTPYHITRRSRTGFLHLSNVRAAERALRGRQP